MRHYTKYCQTSPEPWPSDWKTHNYLDGKVCWSEEIKQLFALMGLDQCGKILSFHNCFTEADKKGFRDVTRIELDNKIFYLKRYLSPKRKEWIRALCLPVFYDSLAAQEWKNYHFLNSLGIHTAIPVAWGEKKRGPLPVTSFIITRNLQGEQLDKVLAKGRDLDKRRNILYSLATLMRKIHTAGYCYPDCKAKHFYIQDKNIAVLDTERLRKFPGWWPKMRWIAKDFANLSKNFPAKTISRHEKLCFLKYYLQLDISNGQVKELASYINKRRVYVALGKTWYQRWWRKFCLWLASRDTVQEKN